MSSSIKAGRFASNRSILAVVTVMAILVGVVAVWWPNSYVASVAINLEDRLPDGALYTPATQSFTRGRHWLDTVKEVRIRPDDREEAEVELKGGSDGHTLAIRKLPLEQLVPRFHYRANSPPDAFDAFNLMLAEFSRNGLSIPVGDDSDAFPHFETNLTEGGAWSLKDDFVFEPNGEVRPIRVDMINNCLSPGLWEMSAKDRAGEIHHSWFTFPYGAYIKLVAETNGIERAFVREALEWRTDPVRLELDRLRHPGRSLGRTSVTLVPDGDVGYSSQDSRRKVAMQYALVGDEKAPRSPTTRRELTESPVRFADFVAPGKYSASSRKTFDVRFLARPRAAEIRRATPRTRYKDNATRSGSDAEAGADSRREDRSLEITIELDGHALLLGNLPIERLVPAEDFAIHGFGVGILPASELAERRRLLFEQGPPPSFAYLTKGDVPGELALNSHDLGLEQVFVRTHIFDSDPWWEITVASFERIVDLVKYRVRIPAELHDELRVQARDYTSPTYLTYRDDNIR